MANNELSGPCLTIYLAKELASRNERKLNYRLVFVPETIGSVTYLSRNIADLKRNVIAGFVLSCVGDDRAYSIVESRKANTLADRALKAVLKEFAPEYKTYSFLKRGSDERQYCSPNVDLPVSGFCRSKYGEYPEYHTSKDDMELVSPQGFSGSFEVMLRTIDLIEQNHRYRSTVYGEPQLGKRGLYPTESYKGSAVAVRNMTNFLAYCDGTLDLIDIAEIIDIPVSEVLRYALRLEREGLITCK